MRKYAVSVIIVSLIALLVSLMVFDLPVVPDNAPRSLSLNEWHNIAVEVVNDGTKIDIISDKTKKAIVFLQNMPSREVLTAYVLIAG